VKRPMHWLTTATDDGHGEHHGPHHRDRDRPPPAARRCATQRTQSSVPRQIAISIRAMPKVRFLSF
jgi:hypothetical protein